MALLGLLLDEAGIGLPQVEDRARLEWPDLPRGAFEAVLSRQELPSSRLVAAFVRACGGEPDRWLSVHAGLTARRGAGQAAAEPELLELPELPPVDYVLPEPGARQGPAASLLGHGHSSGDDRLPPLEYDAPPLPVPVPPEPDWAVGAGPMPGAAGPMPGVERPAPAKRGPTGRHQRLGLGKRLSITGRRGAVMMAAATALIAALAVLTAPDDGSDPAGDSVRAAVPPPVVPGASASPSGAVSPTPSESTSPGSPSAGTTESGSPSGTIAPGASASTRPPSNGRGGGASTLASATKARGNLQAFIRGMGHGDASVCDKYATESWATRTYGSMDMCRKDALNVDEWYRPQEVQAMRTTSVVGSRTSGRNVTVNFSDLRWSSGHMTAETVQNRFVLGSVGGTWKIIG